jgi:isoleucyl-tRNA synthetase
VTVAAGPEDRPFLDARRDLLAALCIVSELEVIAPTEAGGERFTIVAGRSPSPKCERCWNHRASVGRHAEHPTLCDRCARAIERIGGS